MDEELVRSPWYSIRTWGPYALLVLLLAPVVLGYIWLVIASFARNTYGLIPIDGFTLDNWAFLRERIDSSLNWLELSGGLVVTAAAIIAAVFALAAVLRAVIPETAHNALLSLKDLSTGLIRPRRMLQFAILIFLLTAAQRLTGLQLGIWSILLNTLLIAVYMTVTVVLISSMAGYALSRMNFKGRRWFLVMILILHGFPAVTLLIPIFLVLRELGRVPLLGQQIGFNTLGGVALVMVAFELPLGVWLMKGFFDQIPWDIERAALTDGASYFQIFARILMPLIRPGILALGVFSFISGWGAFLIPVTFTIGTRTSNLAIFLNGLLGETALTSWGMVAAVGLFQMIPVMFFFVFAQEYLLNVFAGGSKGVT